MRPLFLLIGSFSITLLTQCSDQKPEDKAICRFTSSQIIEIPSNTSVTYKVHAIYEPDDIFVGYHYPTHSIDLIDLESGTFLKKIPLERTGPQPIAQVQSLYVHHPDSIFLLTTHQILCINQKGESSLDLKINQKNMDITGLDLDKQQIWCNPEHNQPIYYSARNRSLFVGLKPSRPERIQEKYEYPLAGRISIETWEFEYLPIDYPDEFKKGYYGVLDVPQLLFFDDFTIVGFGAGYDLYRYDHTTPTGRSFGFSSDFIQNHATSMNVPDPQTSLQDFEEIKSYFKANPRTAKLRVNRETMTFYNLYYAPDDPDRPHFRTISIFHMSRDGQDGRKVNEFVVDHEKYMAKIFFPSKQGLGLIDQSSTDDLLQVDFMECGGYVNRISLRK